MASSNSTRFLEAFGGPSRVIVVAEIGNNHEGDLGLAREMVVAAAECGADAVKFQHFVPERFIAISEESRLARLRQFALTNDEMLSLFDLSRSLGLEPFATAFDVQTQEWLSQHQKILKIASGDNTFFDLLESAGLSGLPTIISTGFLSHQEVLDLERAWNRQFSTPLALLHCVSAYPADPSELNLSSITHFCDAMPSTPIGFSDHSIGVVASLAAVAMGAFLIEKHFTLHHEQSEFRDHRLSANPREFERLVREVRIIEQLVGEGTKSVTNNESLQILSARRSAAARRDIMAGAKVRKEDIIYLRPGSGFSPNRESEIIGRTLVRGLGVGQLITESDLI